jgi:type VI secretion system protein ImpK
MRKEIADLVYPVVNYALQLKDRLNRGEELSLTNEQAELRGLLKSEAAAKRWGEYAGDAPAGFDDGSGRGPAEQFLGIRYALTCWLDEMFILDSPWKAEWNERKLEAALYGSNDRAWKFWEQARKAEARPEKDALEVFFLCVMLGFRGDLREDPEALRSWREAAEAQIGRPREWTGPPDAQLPPDVPPLEGAQKFQKMALTVGAVVLLLIPVGMFWVVLQFR